MTDSDKSGRSGIVKNVVTSWASQLVFIAFGFILPRAIHESLGQVTLGIWDFGWTIVSYLSMTMIGIGASVNRHVARYRTSGESDKLSSTVSSVFAIQAAIASGVFLMVLVLYYYTPTMMREQLGAEADTAAAIVLYLGSALAVQMLFDSCRGVLTGCHRWGVHNALNSGGYAITGVGMLLVLLQGGGLKGMGQVYLGVTVATELLRYRMSRKACPEIELKLSLANWADTKMMVAFGLKAILIYMPRMILQQTINILVIMNLGAAMLAILSRPLALMGHISTLINKFAFVLTPVAGSLQGGGKNEDLKELALQTTRAGWFLAILPTSFLFLLGDRVIELWMGKEYINSEIMMILAAGSVFPLAQRALITVIMGMNEHGRVAKYSLIISPIIIAIGIVLVYVYGWSLTAAAWLLVVPTNLGMSGVGLVIGCRVLGITPWEYVTRAMRDPLLLLVLAVGGGILVRVYGPQTAFLSLLVGSLVHAVIAGLFLRKELLAVMRPKKAAG